LRERGKISVSEVQLDFCVQRHCKADTRTSARLLVRIPPRPNDNGLMGTPMGTLWERAGCKDPQLLNFQEEMARPERFELPTPRFVVWWERLKSLVFVPARAASHRMNSEFCLPKPKSLPDEVFGTHTTAPASPWQNGFAERLIGSIRRECVDHLIVLGEAHLRRILRAYARYYNDIRTHRSLDKDAPVSRPVQRTGIISSRPILGGLHHHYVRV